jgi:hypothetical protein
VHRHGQGRIGIHIRRLMHMGLSSIHVHTPPRFGSRHGNIRESVCIIPSMSIHKWNHGNSSRPKRSLSVSVRTGHLTARKLLST